LPFAFRATILWGLPIKRFDGFARQEAAQEDEQAQVPQAPAGQPPQAEEVGPGRFGIVLLQRLPFEYSGGIPGSVCVVSLQRSPIGGEAVVVLAGGEPRPRGT
jgi:hypothetical protein